MFALKAEHVRFLQDFIVWPKRPRPKQLRRNRPDRKVAYPCVYFCFCGLRLLRSESPSGKCAKFYTVAASNNRDHASRSFYYCLFAPHIYGRYASCTSRSWWIAHSTQRQPRGCNKVIQIGMPISGSFFFSEKTQTRPQVASGGPALLCLLIWCKNDPWDKEMIGQMMAIYKRR